MHYVWLYEGPQWKQKVYAAGALLIIMSIVMFPLWPYTLRLGVSYLSMGLLGLLGLFFAMAIFRLILFCVTVFTVPPGLWLFPNLFEDVGIIDSFKPIWGWQEVCSSQLFIALPLHDLLMSVVQSKKKKSKSSKGDKKPSKSAASTEKSTAKTPAADITPNGIVTSNTNATETSASVPTQRRSFAARVEEVEDDE
jgi:translocation protein SEC62